MRVDGDIELTEPSRRAGLESWVLFGVLFVGFVIAVVAFSYPIQSRAVELASVGTLVAYAVEGAVRPWPGRRFLRVPGLVWLNLGLLVVLSVLGLLYKVTNQPIGTVHSMKIDLDAHTPVVPIFTIPYLGFFLFYPLTLGWFALHRLDRQLRTGVTALILSSSVGLVTFVIFQTFVEKPAIEGDGPFWYVLRYIEQEVYSFEYYSAFPSLHCALTTIFGIMWVRAAKHRGVRWWKPVVILYVLAVIAATQFLHMHVIMDAIYGEVLAFAAYGVSWWAWESRRALSAVS